MSEKKDIQIRYPSFCVGWNKDGVPEIIAVGDAQDTLDQFKGNRDKTDFQRIAWFRKVKPTKVRATGVKPKKVVSVDCSHLDGDKGRQARKENAERLAAEADSAAAAVITGDNKEDSAPKHRGRPKGK